MEKTQLVRDWRGRDYLVGDSSQDLINRPRSWMFWLPWAAMAAIGPMQYGYAAAVPALLDRHGWPAVAALAPLAVWIVCQAAVALPTALLLRRGALGIRVALWAGGLLSGTALLTVALARDIPTIIVGYALLGGVGAGLVYGACTETVARWYPERPASRVGFTTGAFAYGTAPLAVAVGFDGSGLQPLFVASAIIAWAAIGAAAVFVRLPPRNWWPSHLDPRTWALDGLALRREPRAVRQFSLGQALRTGSLPTLVLILVCAGAVSIFDVVALATSGALASSATATGAAGVTFDGVAPWAAVALLLVLNGAGRACAMLAAEVAGRGRTLSAVLALLTLGQLLLAWGAVTGSEAMLLVATVPAGFGGGAFYPLIASLVREYFGEEHIAPINGVVYSAKAVAGLVGVGLAGLALTVSDHAAIFFLAAALVLAAAALSTTLRQPGHPVTLPR
ncbi:MFS transporter [Streptosporangium lutulentum]|uniref:MFS family permease n=1 Tax=Streptosporangium lutulentum TaxID=1461250 RepID=A0ABT9QFQ7_9ACTN|nr:MFS transporter [Streptosporangium lutulentum]MDP9845593.1 MFS family permease [Streptosporangium lutulentum]